jgi:hypothetical protein
MKIFEQTFIDLVQNALETECPDGSGKSITRTELCKKISLGKEYEPIVGMMISQNIIPGYESRKGPGGGIGKVGQKSAKVKMPLASKVDDNFKKSLLIVLDYMVSSEDDIVTRKALADEMGRKDCENLISAALTLPEFADYESKIGKNGGVRKKRAVVQQDAADQSEIDTAANG